MTDVRTRPAGAGVDDPTVRAVHRRRLPAQAWIVLGLVLVIAVGYVVGFSPLLGVRSVQVTGAQRVSAEQVRASAEVTHGTPLLRLDRAGIARRVDALAVVADTVVRVSYPSTVVIEVHERHPVGLIKLAGGLVGLVDVTGRQFFTQSTRPQQLAVLVPTAPAASQAQTVRALAQVAAALPVALQAKIASINGASPTGVSLALRDGRTVVWGAAERNADKARILSAVLARPGTQFDISNPDLVVAR